MVSIIIPSYNSENTIERCLDALHNQTYHDEYEIILADSSSDKTPEIVKNKYPWVKLIHFKTKTDPGTARNAAIKQSKGNLLLLIDSDCIAAPDWIEQIVIAHKNNNYAAVGGSVLNGNNSKNLVAWAGYMAEFREFLPGNELREVEHIPTCNISYKKEVFVDKNFDARYYPQEDLYFNYQLRQDGKKIVFNPKIQVSHHHRETIKSFLKHQFIIGDITSRMLKKIPLEGSFLVKKKVWALLVFWLLPLIKFYRTINVFRKKEPWIIKQYFGAVFIFALGLLPWTLGFIKGILFEK